MKISSPKPKCTFSNIDPGNVFSFVEDKNDTPYLMTESTGGVNTEFYVDLTSGSVFSCSEVDPDVDVWYYPDASVCLHNRV